MTYEVVLLDPPWSYHGQQDKWGAAAKFYPTMTDEELLAFSRPAEILARRGVMFMWATGPRLDFACRLIQTWGLHFRGVAFVWVKTRQDGITPVGAQGVRPSVVKPTTEFVLAASHQAKGRPLPLADESIRQVVLAPKGEHSAKPVEVMERIEAMYPEASKIELFARSAREGWDRWGLEAPAGAVAI